MTEPKTSLRSLDDQNIVLLGSDGNLGSAFMERFSQHGLNGISFADPKSGRQQIRSTLEADPNSIFIVAVAAQYQVAVHKIILEEITQIQKAGTDAQPAIVTLNSVQDEVTKRLEYGMTDIPENTTLLGLHPHHGHPMTTNPSLGKKWILTHAKRFDRDQSKEETTVRVMRRQLENFFKKAEITDFELFDFDEAAKDLPNFRNGAELHDTLTAYSQALVHMIRILIHDDEVFFREFVTLQVDRDLSDAIVQQNPYAREGIFEKFKQRIPSKADSNFIAVVKAVAREFIAEYESRYSDVPKEIREAAKTPKFIELEQKLSADFEIN